MQIARDLFDKAEVYDCLEQIDDHVQDLRLALDMVDSASARTCVDTALNQVERLKRTLTTIEASLKAECAVSLTRSPSSGFRRFLARLFRPRCTWCRADLPSGSCCTEPECQDLDASMQTYGM